MDGFETIESVIDSIGIYTYLDDEGDECWGFVTSEGSSIMRLIGLLEQAKAAILRDVVAELDA